MNEDAEVSKVEVITLLNDIFVLYDEKIRKSRILKSSQPASSSSRRSSIFLFILHRRYTHASSSSSSSPLSSELEFYLCNNLQSVLDENQIENLDVIGWWKSVKNQCCCSQWSLCCSCWHQCCT